MFGATGSVGQSALDLVSRDSESYDVVALTGGRNVQQLAADAQRLKADVAVTCYSECYDELKSLLAGTGVEVAAGHKLALFPISSGCFINIPGSGTAIASILIACSK